MKDFLRSPHLERDSDNILYTGNSMQDINELVSHSLTRKCDTHILLLV